MTTATPVNSNERMNFLPKFIGETYMIVFENMIFDILENQCTNYEGGYFNFFELSNGGFYTAPSSTETFELSCPNYFTGKMSADAVGLFATAMALNHMSWKLYNTDRKEAQKFDRLFFNVREHILNHEECATILGALD